MRSSPPSSAQFTDAGFASPTGCGDAYRGGLIYGLLNDMDLLTACRIGSVMGAIKIEHMAPQQHTPSPQEIRDRFNAAYGYSF